MAEKKSTPSNPYEGKEVLIGSLVRKWFKPFMEEKILDGLRRTNEPAWMAAAWMYKKNPPTKIVFTGALLAGLTVGENLLDWMGQKSGLVGQLINIAGQQALEDVEGTVREYFERQPDEIFVGYNGPKDSDLTSLGKIGNLHIKQSVSNFFARLPMLLVFNKDGVFNGAGWDLAMSMLMADDETFDNFRTWYKAADKPLKDRAKRVLPTFNNTGEFNLFAAKTHEQMTDQINIAYEFIRNTLVTDEELGDIAELFDKVIGQHAQNLENDLNTRFPVDLERKAERARRHRQGRFQGSPWMILGSMVAVIGAGVFVSTWSAHTYPSEWKTTTVPLFPKLGTVHHLFYEPAWWALFVAVIGLTVWIVATIILHNRRREQN